MPSNDQHRAQSERPMMADDLIEFENSVEEAVPDEIETLATEAPLYLSAPRGAKEAQVEVSRLGRSRLWELQRGRNLVLGRLGEDATAAPRSADGDKAESEFDPHIPDWSGVTYHPKLTTPRTTPVLRRSTGKRVVPHRVFGSDDRDIYYPSGYPWRCIGKIFAWTDPSSSYPAWSGAGALVGTNVVVTASHVCPWGSSPWMMQFIPAYYDGRSLLGSGVSSYVQSYRGYETDDQGNDMAVLKLYTPLGTSLGYFGYRTYDDAWEDGHYWTRCGYAGALSSGQRPNRVTWFPVVDDDEYTFGAGTELEYYADSGPGDSGGPVFGWWGDSPYVIGAHSGWEGEYHFPFSIVEHNLAAGGSALSNLIGWARSNW